MNRDAERAPKELTELRKKLKGHKHGVELCCEEWAHDHSHLQDLCRKAGYSEQEVEGDSYGVPGITDLADMLFKRIEKYRKLNMERDR